MALSSMATGMRWAVPPSRHGAHPGRLARPVHGGAKARGYRVDFIAVHWYGWTSPRPRRPAAAELPAGHLRPVPPAHLGDRVRPGQLRPAPPTTHRSRAGRLPDSGRRMLAGCRTCSATPGSPCRPSAGSGTTGLFDPGPARSPWSARPSSSARSHVRARSTCSTAGHPSERGVGGGPEVPGYLGRLGGGHHPLGERMPVRPVAGSVRQAVPLPPSQP